MLVLSRITGEKIILTVPPSGEATRLEVMLVDVRQGKKARLGIEAPAAVTVHRSEIQAAIDREISSSTEQTSSV